MKKYFLHGSTDELHIGDTIELDVTKELPSGKIRYHHLECKFLPELIPLLLKEGIVEEKEVEEQKNNNVSFSDASLEDELNIIVETIKSCADRLNSLALALMSPVKKARKNSAQKAHRK